LVCKYWQSFPTSVPPNVSNVKDCWVVHGNSHLTLGLTATSSTNVLGGSANITI
jgi:hypothetical protein